MLEMEANTRVRELRGYLRVVLLLVAVAVIATLSLPAWGTAQEVCPEEGKVESQNDGDLDDIVLEAGTEVCIKGGNTVVYTTADGTSTLAELLGNNKNVSHYTVISTTTTTTLVEETTTTLDTTTTTTPLDKTSTTQATTTLPPGPRGGASEPPTTVVPVPTTTAPITLPFTGLPFGVWGVLALIVGLVGWLLVVTSRPEFEDER